MLVIITRAFLQRIIKLICKKVVGRICLIMSFMRLCSDICCLISTYGCIYYVLYTYEWNFYIFYGVSPKQLKVLVNGINFLKVKFRSLRNVWMKLSSCRPLFEIKQMNSAPLNASEKYHLILCCQELCGLSEKNSAYSSFSNFSNIPVNVIDVEKKRGKKLRRQTIHADQDKTTSTKITQYF